MAITAGGLALSGARALYGFTVDDAFIVSRYAHHLASGLGYRFNPHGESTDGVTPLGFAHLVAAFGPDGPLEAFMIARGLGIVAWVATAVIAAVLAFDRVGPRRRLLPLAVMLTSVPLAAWASAGLATPIAALLATSGFALRLRARPWLGSLGLGAAAAWRPEMLPFALVLTFCPPRFGARVLTPPGIRAAFLRAMVTMVPVLATGIVRYAAFGHVAPLAALAKAPVASLGLRYALACALLTGVVLLLAPRAFLRVAPTFRVAAIAVVTHYLAVGVAGGDWMPLSRLVVPVLPVLVVTGGALASQSAVTSGALRVVIALCANAFVAFRVAPDARQVEADRLALIEAARPHLVDRARIATLDVGWVGVACQADILDLAGVTDPTVAALPGGHTSKRIPLSWLDERDIDAMVLLLRPGEEVAPAWTASSFSRWVELYVAAPSRERDFAVEAVTEVPSLRYVIVVRSGEDPLLP